MQRTLSVLCLSLLLAWSSLFAQDNKDFELTLGSTFESDSNVFLPSIVGIDESGYYVVNHKVNSYTNAYNQSLKGYKYSQFHKGYKSEAFLRKFDHDLNLIKKEKINLGGRKELESLEKILLTLDNFFIFSFIRKKKDVFLYYRKVNKETLKHPEQGTLILSASYDGFSSAQGVSIGIRLSQDSSKVLIYYPLPTEKKETNRFAVHVFDHEMTPLWKNEFSLPTSKRFIQKKDFHVTNGGRVLFLEKCFPEKNANKYDYTFKIFVLNPGAEAAEEYNLGQVDKPLVNANIHLLENDNIICIAGFMEGDKKDNNVKGICYYKLDGNTLEVLSESYSYLPQKTLVELGKSAPGSSDYKSSTKKIRFSFESLSFSRVIPNFDGGMVVAGEIMRYDLASAASHDENYENNDILVLFIDQEEQIKRVSVIRKLQYHWLWDFDLSYSLAATGDRLHFIYNDRLENLSIDNKSEPKRIKKMYKDKYSHDCVVTMATMNPNGEFNKSMLINSEKTDILAYPMTSVQISGNEMILIVGNAKEKDRMLAKLTFK